MTEQPGEARRQRYEDLVQVAASHHPDFREHREATLRLQAALAADQVESSENLAAAADKHAKALTRATWVLAFATAILAVATVVLVVVTALA